MELFSHTTIHSGNKGHNGLIIAGVHGDEYEPMLTVLKLIRQLEGKLVSGTLTLVPVVNQSAFFAASRVGEDGLDLARTCPGNPDGSITEQVASEISGLISQADFLVDMHTGGDLFRISPLAGYILHPSPKILSVQREMAHAFNLPIIWGTNHELQGRTLSVARDEKVPAIYTEYGGGGYHPETEGDLLQGCRRVLSYFGMLESMKTRSTDPVTIEDPSPQSGHLQLMYPSPVNGFFLASVQLNQWVKKGQLLGEIIDFEGKVSAKITAGQEGMVFLIRAVPMANKGDALAGILPFKRKNKR